MNPTESLLLQAAHWHAIASGRDLSADESASLDKWLGQHPRHRLAYADVCAAAFALEQSGAAQESVAAPAARSSARPLLRWSFAAAPLLLLALVIAGPRVAPTWQNMNSDVYTEIGQPQQRTLSDGSVLELDTDSAVRVSMGTDRRDIELLRGRLSIAVAKDPSRPLHVTSGGVDAMAVGTRFVVDRGDSGTGVGVHEGIVRVVSGKGTPVDLTAGQQAFVAAGEEEARIGRRASLDEGWTKGVLSVEQMPLAEVLEELDRYLPERIILANNAQAGRLITATLPLDDPAAALRVLAQTSQLSLRRIPRVAYVMR